MKFQEQNFFKFKTCQNKTQADYSYVIFCSYTFLWSAVVDLQEKSFFQ